MPPSAQPARDPYTYMILFMETAQKDDLLEAFEHGADDYLVKPFDGYELRAKLLVAKRILGLQDRLIAMRDELLVQATHDSLTGLWNRRASRMRWPANWPAPRAKREPWV